MGGASAERAPGLNGAGGPSGALLADLAGFGLQPSAAADFACIRRQAARLIGPHIASVAVLKAVAARDPASLTVRREGGEIAGVLAFMPLRPAALMSVATERFDPANPSLDLIAAAGEWPAAVHLWGLAAVTKPAAAAILGAAGLLRRRLPHVPFFARAATPESRELLRRRLGYTPFPGSVGDLLWSPSISFDDEGR